MLNWLRMRAVATPQATALLYASHSYTYSELSAHSDRATAQLKENGVRPGQHIALLLATSVEYVILIHALAQLGAVLVPLNLRLTISEILPQLRQAMCTHVVSSSETAHIADLFPREIRSTDIAALVNLRDESPLTTDTHEQHGEFLPSATSNHIHSIVFTSGTTGQPKGVKLTYANHFHSATSSSYRLGIVPSDKWLLCMPLWHVGGLAIVLRSCLYGIGLVLMENGFDAAQFVSTLDKQQITLVSLVPSMLHQILAQTGQVHPPHSLRCALLGGAGAHEDLLLEAIALRWPIAVTYGLTEAASQVCTAPPELTKQKPGTVGKPLFGLSLEVCSSDGQRIHTDRIGELVVSGPTVMQGYCGTSEDTRAVLKGGRLYTGDMGYIDQDGDLWVDQRLSDLIISGAENVNPEEVETTLCKHPAVHQACVIGIDDPEWGQRVAALVVASTVTANELQQFCRQTLADYKQPRVIQFVDELPRTHSGKLKRVAALELLSKNP